MSAGVVVVGVTVPPVLDGVVVGVGVTDVPPDEDVLGDVGATAVVDVDVVEVVLVVVAADAAGVPPEGGAVSTGVVKGTL